MGVFSRRAFGYGIAALAAVALSLALSSPVRADPRPSAAKSTCVARALGRLGQLWTSSTDYVNTVKKEGWKSALVRPRKESEMSYPKRWRIFKRLERSFEDRVLGPRNTLTGPARFVMNVAVVKAVVKGGPKAVGAVNTAYHATTNTVTTAYQNHEKKKLLHLIQTDYRYDDIDQFLNLHAITEDVAVARAQARKTVLEAFDRKHPSDPKAAIQELQTNNATATLFDDLNHMVNGFIYKLASQNADYQFAPGVKATSTPTNAQIDQVYALELQKWEAFQEIPKWFHSASGNPPKNLDAASKAIYDSIQNSPLTQKLEPMLHSHQMTTSEFQYLLMKDYSSETLFEQYQVMGVQRLNASDHKSVVTIDDVRAGILDSLMDRSTGIR